MSDQLTAIADRIELTELINREAFWLDEDGTEGAEAFFTEDVAARTPGGQAEGPAALGALAHRSHSKYARTHHVPAGLAIDLDGDTAEARFSALIVFTRHDGQVLVRTARYRVEARRTDAGWRLSRLETTPSAGTAPLPGD